MTPLPVEATFEAHALAFRIAKMLGNSQLSHDEKFTVLTALLKALGSPK
jgi:hypothetical protein